MAPRGGRRSGALLAAAGLLLAPLVDAVAPPPAFECTRTLPGFDSWSSEQRAWCCASQGLGCPPGSEPFDCDAGYANWDKGWSAGKREWCCLSRRRGCSGTPEPFNCAASYRSWKGWPLKKKEWCCLHTGRGCLGTTLCPEKKCPSMYNCSADVGRWRLKWSASKMDWCCRRRNLGCLLTPPPAGAGDAMAARTQQAPRSMATVEPSTTTLTTAVHMGPRVGCDTLCDTAGQFMSCRDRIQYAVDHDFAVRLKPYQNACVMAHGLVLRQCPSCAICGLADASCTTPVPTTTTWTRTLTTLTTTSLTSTSTTSTTTLTRTQTTTLPFYCHVGLERWWALWSPEKTAWCCRSQRLGCPTTSTHSAAPSTTTAMVLRGCDTLCNIAGQSVTCRARIQYSAANEFRERPNPCLAAHALVLQQCPCCAVCGLAVSGCTTLPPTTTTTTTTTAHYDCSAGLATWQKSWCAAQQKWCCQHRHVGCPQTTQVPSAHFDCAAGYSKWIESWSIGKKDWCCRHKRRGCLVITTSRIVMPTTTTTAAFNCSAGYANWRRGWSATKQRWCCSAAGRGCARAAGTTRPLHDCTAGREDLRHWSLGKQRWCCMHRDIGCREGVHFGRKFDAPLRRGAAEAATLRAARALAFYLAVGLLGFPVAFPLVRALVTARCCARSRSRTRRCARSVSRSLGTEYVYEEIDGWAEEEESDLEPFAGRGLE